MYDGPPAQYRRGCGESRRRCGRCEPFVAWVATNGMFSEHAPHLSGSFGGLFRSCARGAHADIQAHMHARVRARARTKRARKSSSVAFSFCGGSGLRFEQLPPCENKRRDTLRSRCRCGRVSPVLAQMWQW